MGKDRKRTGAGWEISCALMAFRDVPSPPARAHERLIALVALLTSFTMFLQAETG
jgi:hypothetical protein